MKTYIFTIEIAANKKSEAIECLNEVCQRALNDYGAVEEEFKITKK